MESREGSHSAPPAIYLFTYLPACLSPQLSVYPLANPGLWRAGRAYTSKGGKEGRLDGAAAVGVTPPPLPPAAAALSYASDVDFRRNRFHSLRPPPPEISRHST